MNSLGTYLLIVLAAATVWGALPHTTASPAKDQFAWVFGHGSAIRPAKETHSAIHAREVPSFADRFP